MQVTRSPASESRRAQILDATIAVVAEEGFARATFARIAARGGLSSTRLISYHFAGKGELVAALVEHVVTGIGAHVGERVTAASTARGRLAAYIEGVVSYADAHRAPMTALLRVAMAGAGGASMQDAGDLSHLERILREGQEAGEMRDFDASILATTVQRAVEVVPFRLQAESDLDCRAYAAELVELFDRATRAEA
ncbi:TetR/AcrR family transcriptional regulator [Nocardioides hwasunensis]|uniref:TetR family transcriptional regulator n=1 Tax=Nocardioides hwasunensis TaxID=397258 RepID=A0ABR8MID5_9ACTN|nr:TetR family transcriptional regulator [Nocardioides hwasunensis]MBD3915340.1 TetR family transcriptional regulator [Nocardioides hwasunensis]